MLISVPPPLSRFSPSRGLSRDIGGGGHQFYKRGAKQLLNTHIIRNIINITIVNLSDLTKAHKTLPIGSVLRAFVKFDKLTGQLCNPVN